MSWLTTIIGLYMAAGLLVSILGMVFYPRAFFRHGLHAFISALFIIILFWPPALYGVLHDFAQWFRRTFLSLCLVLLLGWHLVGSQALGGGLYRLHFRHWTGAHRTVITDDPALKGGAL